LPVRFALVGASNSLVDWGLLTILTVLDRQSVFHAFWIVQTLSWFGATLWSRYAHRRWSFRRPLPFWGFWVVASLGLGIQSIILASLRPWMTSALHLVIAKALAIGVAALWSFGGYSRISRIRAVSRSAVSDSLSYFASKKE